MTTKLGNISPFSPETNEKALNWAYQQIMDDPKFYKSKDPKIFKLQVAIYAKGLPEYWKPKTVTQQYDLTPDEIEAKILADIIKHDKDISTRLMGVNSIYAGISLYDPIQTLNTQVVDYFKTSYSSHHHKNCLILGATGSGKTYGVVGYVISLAEVSHGNVNAAFLRAYQLYEAQQSNTDEAKNYRTRLEMVRYLIIDDLGTEPQAGFRGSDFLAYFQNLFIARHEQQKNTFITSNTTLDGFTELYGDRFISRLRETGVVFETTDPDFRRLKREEKTM